MLAITANRSIAFDKPVDTRLEELYFGSNVFFLLFVGAVVGALAYRAVGVSCCVFVSDCGDVQVLQSSDMSLPDHG